ncbi:D-sedoheptulose-7-phosphate isomerase [Saccharopolyspora erythraea]|uniref:D-sedoheptulose-7-phosphate isomerase n=1 Tax=Saccharopolyspora erythraea TaxID=1836 RepID=UPI0004977DC1|nr:SIS domain-containing protein [Saccharopolyspora erythraea]
MDSTRGEASGTEALYPFLSPAHTDVGGVLNLTDLVLSGPPDLVMALREQVRLRDGRKLVECAEAMAERFRAGARLFAFGNGGSSTDAQDLASLFLHPGPGWRALPAFGLTSDIAVVTALSNDVGFDVVFARQIGAFGRPQDIAVGLSTSGNSANLLRAFDEAARRGMLTVGIAGDRGGKMAESAGIHHLFVVPSASVHRIQEAQTTLYHALWELTATALGPAD